MDNRTLFACQILLTMVYSVAFLGMRRMYRHLSGTGSFALGFFSGFLGCILIVLRGGLPNSVAVVGEHFLIFSAFLLFYRGLLLFFRSPRTTRFVTIMCVVALFLLAYFSAVEDRIAARIVIVSLVLLVLRGLIAVELFRQAEQRSILNVFGALMAAYALFGAVRAVATFLHGPPYDFMQTSRFQTPALMVNLLFICIIGLFFLLMLSSELVAIVETRSLYDHVSGALNRRGIDQGFALELVRAERNGYELAVALIDIDHFKQINDTAGHAAGDAALKQVVEVISSRLRSYDFFGRYGGDEFLLVFSQTSFEDALRIAERIGHAVSGLAVSRLALPITLSIGLTLRKSWASGNLGFDPMRKALPLTIDFSHACGVLIHEIDGASSCDSPIQLTSRPLRGPSANHLRLIHTPDRQTAKIVLAESFMSTSYTPR